MELTRKQVILNLEKFLDDHLKISGFADTELFETLVYAIFSLKTDEAYQLMHEGVKVYTEDEVIAILEELQLETVKKVNNRDFMSKKIQEIIQCSQCPDDDFQSGYNACLVDNCNFIQEKINALKGGTDG
jgi:hypothetical protein